jgi:hypothetical protein
LKFGDIDAGILKRDELAAAGQRDRFVEGSLLAGAEIAVIVRAALVPGIINH